MGMAMPVTMAMTVESGTAEAAICRGATLNEASIRVARSIWHASGTAIDTRHKTHRYRADRRGTHHGQDDAAGTFHDAALETIVSLFRHARLGEASESPFFHSIVQREMPLASAAAGKMRSERMRKSTEAPARHRARSGIGRRPG